MLWQKSWWETRWLFLIGLASIFLAYGLTFGWGDYDAANWTERLQRNTSLSESERQALNNYQGQIWALWFKWIAPFVLLEAVFFALFLSFLSLGTRPWWNILGVMAGESYFYHGQIPWPGLLISLILSAVFIFTAVRIYERRDL